MWPFPLKIFSRGAYLHSNPCFGKNMILSTTHVLAQFVQSSFCTTSMQLFDSVYTGSDARVRRRVPKPPQPQSQLCVLGEHTDWAAGYRDQNRAIPPGMAIVATTREGLHARVIPRKDGRLVFKAACPNPSTSNQHSSCSSDNAGGGEPAAAAVPGSDGAAGSVDPVRTLDVAMTGEVSNGVGV